jgi:hypothetical protein
MRWRWAVHQWASLSVTKYPDPLSDDHILAHTELEKKCARDKFFLANVEQRCGTPLLGIVKAAFCMAGWAAVLWATVSLVAFFILGRWYLPLVADLG